MRLIDPNALAKHIKDLPTWWADDGGVYPGGSMKYPDGMYYPDDIISSIDNAPTVDAVEVVHGRWEYGRWEQGRWVKGNERCRCSVCHRDFAVDNLNVWHGCPQCLAKMDGGNEDGNL